MDFDAIKAHPSFPFTDFQSDDLQFLMLELYWAELFRLQWSAPNAEASPVTTWEVRFPADRADGNPILSVINRTLSPPRALRVIQRFNSENLPVVSLDDLKPVAHQGEVYVPFVPDLTGGAIDDDGESPIEELVISSDVSSACEELFSNIVRPWCVDVVDPQSMRETLDLYWTSIRSKLI